jgi:hypothetical protein
MPHVRHASKARSHVNSYHYRTSQASPQPHPSPSVKVAFPALVTLHQRATSSLSEAAWRWAETVTQTCLHPERVVGSSFDSRRLPHPIQFPWLQCRYPTLKIGPCSLALQCRGKRLDARRPVDAISTRRAHLTAYHTLVVFPVLTNHSQHSVTVCYSPRTADVFKPPKCLTPQSCRFRKIYEPLITALKGWHREVSRRLAALLSPCPHRAGSHLHASTLLASTSTPWMTIRVFAAIIEKYACSPVLP